METLKKRRRTKAELEQHQATIIRLLEEYHPQSIRQLFYQLVTPGLEGGIEKTDRNYQNLIHQLVKMRDEMKFPMNWIADHTRRAYKSGGTQSSLKDMLIRTAIAYRSSVWQMMDERVEVWCESESLAGVLQPTCRDLDVDLWPTKGQPSRSYMYEAANAASRQKKNLRIFYIGDYDPHGFSIEETVENRMRIYLFDWLNWKGQLSFDRIVVTQQQIDDLGLERKPREPGDKFRPDVDCIVQAEAIKPPVMQQILRDAVNSVLPEGLALQMDEQDERESDSYMRFLKLMTKERVEQYAGFWEEIIRDEEDEYDDDD